MDTSLSITAQPTPQRARNEGVDEVRRHHGHERRAERRSERREEREDRYEAFAELKVKITQTLTAQVAPAPAAETNANSDDSAATGSVEIALKAGLQVSGGDFGSALQSFAETLFSALQTLYGTPPQATQAAAADASPAVLVGASTDPVEAPADTPADTPVVAETPSTDPVVAEPTTAATPSVGSGSLSIRLRLAYTSFDSQLGTLAQRLAQPDVGSTVPAVGAMFGDLAERFSQLQSAVAGAADAHPNLASFLKSLAQAFGGNQPAAPAVDNGTAPAATAVPGSLSIRFSAVMRYEQTACNSTPALAVA